MNFWTFLLSLAVIYCIYRISQLEKRTKGEELEKGDKNKTKTVLYERFLSLQGCLCEVQFEQMMYYMGANWNNMVSLRGIVEQVDQEWVLLYPEKDKKEVQYLLRIANIKDVYELR